MPTLVFESTLKATPEELSAWHLRPGAFERLRPPWQALELVEPAPVADGSRVRLRLRRGPVALSWTAEHREVEPGRGFVDVQTAGPFARWVHRHEFLPAPAGALLRDAIDYRLPGGAAGRLIAGRAVRRDIERTFAFRHETTRRDLARHRAFAGAPRLRVAVTGSSGLVGSHLVPFLTTGGHAVVRLVRGAAAPGAAAWSVERGIEAPATLGGADAVVHLAGESLAAGRWTAARKARIRRSRVAGTRHLVRSLARLDRPPAVFVSASAIGYYGSRADELVDETGTAGEGFLAEVCREWEEAAAEAESLGMRTARLRFGVILTPAGGALAKMLPAFRLGAGGPIGGGGQYLSWVTIDDAVAAIYQALLDPRLAGAVNVVAPAPVTQRRLARSLGKVLRRPALLPLPAPAARALFGEMADEMLLASTRVAPTALDSTGFKFDDPRLEPALERLLGRTTA